MPKDHVENINFLHANVVDFYNSKFVNVHCIVNLLTSSLLIIPCDHKNIIQCTTN